MFEFCKYRPPCPPATELLQTIWFCGRFGCAQNHVSEPTPLKSTLFVKEVIPTKVVIPVTFNLSTLREAELTPTVTIPADIGVTDKLSAKFIVPAVPTTLPSFFTTTPEPDPITLVNPEPSPTKLVAVITPVILTLPVPVIDLLNRSKLPPS